MRTRIILAISVILITGMNATHAQRATTSYDGDGNRLGTTVERVGPSFVRPNIPRTQSDSDAIIVIGNGRVIEQRPARPKLIPPSPR